MPNGFDVGSYVWIDGDNGYSVPAVVIGVSGSTLKVQNEKTGKISSLSVKLAIQRIDYGTRGAEDMIKMDDLNEGSILYNLARRYNANLIYTYIGKILVAVNPYKLHDIYTNENVDKYTKSTIGSLPPHIFAIGSAAYSEVQRNEMNQVIIISGESGAGKTESTKLLVQYLATANKTKGSLITEQIVEATPLLESFGNAKTVKNDNSSRFGKYLEIYFSNSGSICGGRISEYLLERSRIVSQSIDERNYHIFYEMLTGLPLETKSKLSLKNADDYAYLNQGGTSLMPSKDDRAVFQNVLTAMDVLRITSSEKDGIFTTLAAILHLGNAQFYKGLASSHDVAVLKDEEEAKIAARLLGLSSVDVIQALTHKNTETRGEQISSPRNTDQAIDARDALAKELYSRVFTWLVNRINSMVFHGKKGPSIAILDIFGFEDFQTNSFEQLCINYANESLQFFFNQFVFKLEQDEYHLEGIQWHELSYTDNQACLDLLARSPHGILHLLTDESNFPKATDASFLEKCHQYHKQNKVYFKPKMQAPEFGVSHFAGPVTYQVRGFLDKNRDSLKQDLTDLLCKCRSLFARDLISDLVGDPTMQIGGLKGIRNSKVNSLKAPPNSIPKNTVCAKFNDSLIRLVVAMKRCNPFFIRCIKPNQNKAPGAFVQNLVMQQLRYSGVLETVKVRKIGYPVRIGYQDFVTRYKCLSSRMILCGSTSQQNCVIIMEFMEIQKEDYQLGRTKLFLRENVEFQLEESRRAKQMRMAVVIQSRVRGYMVNQQYLQMKKATIVLQSNARRFLARKKYQKARSGFLMLQAMFRMRRQRRKLTFQLQSQDESKQTSQTEVSAESPKINMESKDMEKQAMVDVTQLEIPAELAMVYARLDDWQVPYENTLGPVNSEVIKFVCSSAELPSDIDDHWFSKYAQKHFQQENKLRFVRAPIHNSMLKLKYSDSIEAVSVFKLIMRFMEDETLSGVRELILGNYIIQKGIFNPELQDEILAQLCNQTWGNQVNSYLEKAWLLISMCLACYKPSDALFNSLLKYSSDHAYNGFKAYCQEKLLCWNARKRPIPRSLPPTYLEWQAAKRKCSVALKCESVDGDKKIAEVYSCTTGEELATTILKDRGVREPRGWSIDVYDPDCHYSLPGHDYVMDVISEQEYPPNFPPGFSPSLVTLRPGNKLKEFRKRALSDLHRAHHKKAKVAEIAHKFSFSEGLKAPSSPSGPKEDGLSAATSARLLSSHQHTTGPQEDKLVAQTSMRTKTEAVVDGQITNVPPPPPPPLVGPVPPPPPPPPPIAPTTDNKIRRRLTSKEGNKRKKKPEPSGPQLSMAEVMAQAKKMSEARRSRVISLDDKEANGTDVDPVEFKIGNLKKVQRNEAPKKEEPGNELKRVMQAKANRASRLWQENENLESILYRKDGGENQSEAVAEVKDQPITENETKSSLPSSSSQNDEEFPTIAVNNNSSISSNSSSCSLANKQDVSAFVDSLFDPVLSSNFNDLADEQSVSNAIRGGGGMNQPTGSTQTSTTLAGASPPTVSMSSPMTTPIFVPMARTPVSGMYNGYSGYTEGRYIGVNGYAGGTPNMVSPGMMAISGYPTPPQDLATVAAQQQMLIEHLMTQQKVIHEQQRQLSQKSTDHLALLQQQHEQQMKVLQEQLDAAKAGLPNGIPNGIPLKTSNDTSQGAALTNGSLVNGHGSEPLVTSSTSVLDRVKSMEPPPPPPEFSDQENSHSTKDILIPPPPFTAPPEPPVPPPPMEEPSMPYPPPPLTPPPPVPQAGNISKSSGVASAVAALEGKSPVSKRSSIEMTTQTAVVTNEEQIAKPALKSRHSSNLAVFVQEDKNTVKLNMNNNLFLSAGTTSWKMSLRKEVFSPKEKLDNLVEQRLVYLQIVRDSYSGACCRMRATDCSKMKTLLQKYGISPEHPHSSTPVEEIIVQTARDLPLYFSRFFTIIGQNELPDVHYITVGEKGVFLVKREKMEDELTIVNEILYEDIENVRVVKNKVVFSFKERKITVPTSRAEEVKMMIDPYLIQIEKEAKYVRAMYDHVTQEANMLNFKKGDVIQIIDKPDLEDGMFFGVLAGRNGCFPTEYVTHIKEDPDAVPKSNLMKAASVGSLNSTEHSNSSPDLPRQRAGSTRSTKSDKSEYGQETYSMMEFAMHNFRHGQEVVHRQPDGTVRGTLRLKGKQSQRGSQKNLEWTWKGLAELVKYSRTPIQGSLLRLEPQNNKSAIECFHAIMKFMGDMQMGRSQKDTDLVYFLIKTCRENPVLCDEVYCQLVKQVTSNKSTQLDSCSRGWRLMIIMTSYIMCEKTLKPYLVKFLQSTACDPKREFHGAASICEQNLMKTFKYGGRRTHPSPVELKQLVQGRQTRRQVFLLPGNIKKMIKIQTCSTGYDVIKEMCNDMDLSTEGDYIEYGLFRSDVKQNNMIPIQTTDYVMDVIGQMEKQNTEFSLCFRRVLWNQTSRFDNELYVTVIYHQILPDYLAGYLTGVSHDRNLTDAQLHNQVAELAALQLLANENDHHTPVQSDVDKVIPRFIREKLRPHQWLILVQDHFRSSTSTPAQSRKKFLEIVSQWQFFGCSFFSVKYCSHPNVAGECIAAINRNGINFVHGTSKQLLQREMFERIISTRILISDKKRFFLDLKIGDSMVQKVTRMETQEAKEIASLIYSYVNVASTVMNRPNEGLAGVIRQKDLKL